MLLSAKDYLYGVLTGQPVTDPSTAAGYALFDLETGTWAPALCRWWAIDPQWLPRIAPPTDRTGTLTSEGARLLGLPVGTPVCVGAADSVAGALAACGTDPATVCVMTGSSTVILLATPQPMGDPSMRFLVTPHAGAGWFAYEMDLLTTGSAFRWLLGLLGRRSPPIHTLAASSPPGARGLFFSPYLAGGEQGAIWNPCLRGSLLGLSLHHEASDVARALIEGVQCEIGRCVAVLRERNEVRHVMVTGLHDGDDVSARILANVLGMAVSLSRVSALSARGAALLAMGDSDAPRALAGSTIVAPDSAQAEYGEIYARYLEHFPG
jgi:sugar (pentulose or hexulose) kinase